MNDRTSSSNARHSLGAVGWLLASALLIAGCSAGAQASTGASGSPSPTASPPPPAGSGGGLTAGGSGDGSVSSPNDPGGALPPDADSNAELVQPVPGRLDPHDTGITKLAAHVEGHHVWIRATFWGGVKPCFALDSTTATRSGSTITVGLRSGADANDVMCIDIAKLYATVIDLGDVDPGRYTVKSATGDAPPISIVVT
jgi:hypothetical protein